MRWKIICMLGAAALGLGAVWLLSGKTAPSKPVAGGSARVAKAEIAAIDRVLRLSGQTSARNFRSINAPMLRGPESGKSLVLMKLVTNGSLVKKGELIASIDAQSTADHVDDVADLIKQADADIRKRKAEQDVEWEQLQQTLRQSKSDMEKARLDAKTTVLLTDIERELLKLNQEEAEARYQQLQQDLAFHKAANQSEIRILELTKVRQQRHHERHAGDLQKFTVHAPTSGLAVMQMIWRGGDFGQVREGDQVGPGQLFMKVADPSSMQVEGQVNQVESAELRIGQPAVIHLDAFPGTELHGRIYTIGALATSGWLQQNYIRNIPVRIAIEDASPKLIPDLSASCDVLLEKTANALAIPLAAVHEANGRATVLVRDGGAFAERAVTLGARNDSRVAVLGGLRPGDEVRLN